MTAKAPNRMTETRTNETTTTKTTYRIKINWWSAYSFAAGVFIGWWRWA